MAAQAPDHPDEEHDRIARWVLDNPIARQLAGDARAAAQRFYTAVALRHADELDRCALAQRQLAELVTLEQQKP